LVGLGFMPFFHSSFSMHFSAASLIAPPPTFNVPTLAGTATAVAIIDGLGDEVLEGDEDANNEEEELDYWGMDKV
jgi:hypothetical protein